MATPPVSFHSLPAVATSQHGSSLQTIIANLDGPTTAELHSHTAHLSVNLVLFACSHPLVSRKFVIDQLGEYRKLCRSFCYKGPREMLIDMVSTRIGWYPMLIWLEYPPQDYMEVPPPWDWIGVLSSQDWIAVPHPPSVNILKILPSLILQMWAVLKSMEMLWFLFVWLYGLQCCETFEFFHYFSSNSMNLLNCIHNAVSMK